MTQEEGGVFAARRDAVRTPAAEMLEQTGEAGTADCSLGRVVGGAVVVLGGTPGCWIQEAAEGGTRVCGDGRVKEG